MKELSIKFFFHRLYQKVFQFNQQLLIVKILHLSVYIKKLVSRIK